MPCCVIYLSSLHSNFTMGQSFCCVIWLPRLECVLVANQSKAACSTRHCCHSQSLSDCSSPTESPVCQANLALTEGICSMLRARLGLLDLQRGTEDCYNRGEHGPRSIANQYSIGAATNHTCEAQHATQWYQISTSAKSTGFKSAVSVLEARLLLKFTQITGSGRHPNAPSMQPEQQLRLIAA